MKVKKLSVNILYMVIVMIVITFTISAITNYIIYKKTENFQRETLKNLVVYENSFITTLYKNQINKDSIISYYKINSPALYNPNLNTEFVIAEIINNDLVFKLRADLKNDSIILMPINQLMAEPLIEAIKGKTGTIIGKDYKNTEVIAAYTYIDDLNWVLIAKIDLNLFKAPYFNIFLISILICIILITVAAFIFYKLSNPIIEIAKENQLYFQNIFDNSADGIIIYDLNGKITDCNDKFQEIAGYSKSEITGKSINEINSSLLTEFIDNEIHSIDMVSKGGVGFPAECRFAKINLKNYELILCSIRDVSLISEIRNKNLEQEIKFRHFFENSLDAVLITSPDGTIHNANPAACKMFGLTEEEIILRGRDGLVDLDDDRLLRYLKERKAKGAARGELLFVRGDGSKFEADVSSSIFTNNNGEQFTSLIIHDISGRKVLTNLLKESEYRFRMALQDTPVTVYNQDKNLIYTWIYNPDTSFRSSEIVGKSDYHLFDNETADKLTSIKKEVLKNGLIIKEFIELNINGSKQYHDLTIIPQKNDKDEISGIFCSSIDISRMKEAENKLIESEKRFKALVETTSGLIWETNLEGQYIYISPYIKELLGYEVFEVIGKSPFEFTPEAQKIGVKSDSEFIVQSQKPFHNYVNKMQKKDGTVIICDTSGIPIFDNNNKLAGYRGISIDITKQNEYIDELKFSEERYKSLFYDNLSIMFIIDPENGNIVDVNKSAERFYGWDRDTLTSMSVGEINTLNFEQLKEKMQNAVDKSQVFFEFRHRRANGSIKDVEVFSSKVISRGKTYLHSIVHDITARKKAENEIILNNERLKSQINLQNYNAKNKQDLLDFSLNEAIELTQSKIGYIYLYNDDKKEFILNSWSREVMAECKVVNPETCYELDKTGIWGEAVRQGKEIILNDFQAFNPLKKGYPEGHVMLRKYMTIPIFDLGKIVAVVGVANKEADYDEADLMQLKLLMNNVWRTLKRFEAEEKVKLLARAIEQSPVNIIITSPDGTIEYVNQKSVNSTGYSAEELIGNNPRIFKSNYHDSDFYENLWATIISGNNWNGEILNRRKDGKEYWEQCLISPMISENGDITHFIALKEDITEKKQRIEELIRAKEIAEESERLKSFFLANISHELRTPMNGILGFAKLIKESDEIDDVREFIEYIKLSAERLLNTLNLMIDLSRLESGETKLERTLFIPSLEVNDVVCIYQSAADNKKIELNFDNRTSEEEITSYPLVLRNITTNLLDNAIKFTHEGGIDVVLSLSFDDNANYIELKIKDTGIGIENDKQELIFDVFRQGDEGLNRSYEGLGLGLTLTKKLIDKVNGSIYLESETGKGSTFTVRIPIYDYINLETTTEIIPDKIGEEELKHKILIVEDNKTTNQLINRLLRNVADVDNAYNFEEALIKAEKENYDLIFIDIYLGYDKNGFDVARSMKMLKNCRNVPLIALTAYSDIQEYRDLIEIYMDGVVSKPFSREELIDKINKHIVRKQNNE